MDDFDAFYEAEYGEVLRSVTLALGDRARAEEVTQEAFVRALQRWTRVREMESPAGWVVVVAVNAERRRWRREPAVLPDAIALPADRDHAGHVATQVDLREALERLSGRQRAAIVLRYLVDLPIAEIATALACAEGTVKATLAQALAILRVDLDGSDNES
jgi:RNA polymerase sigma-70 factor (ECF subfamily)